ncbi:MAG: nitroreductase family protein [Desulfuromonas thiophila]|nr:nitroreductase family protein [Desulfuromonas thiophila]
MTDIFRQRLRVTAAMTDENGHVNNVEYIRWMQQVAIAHSRAQGGLAILEPLGCTWVARRHEIEYLQPALPGQIIELQTWVSDLRKVRSLRKYRFVRCPDGMLLAQAQTDWVFVETASGRPRSVPDALIRCYPLVGPEREQGLLAALRYETSLADQPVLAADLLAPAATPLHPLLRSRFSPYVFAPRSVAGADLTALFEAARWAPSAYNEQPWRYLLTERGSEAFAQLLACLVPGNQEWAGRAPVLVLCLCQRQFSANGKPNPTAAHDLGLATGNLQIEAGARGLQVHPMSGFDPAAAAATFAVPETVRPVAVLAIGYTGDQEDAASAELWQRDQQRRPRRPTSDFLFAGRYGQPWQAAES